MNLIKKSANHAKLAHSASLGRFEGPFSPTMNLGLFIISPNLLDHRLPQQIDSY